MATIRKRAGKWQVQIRRKGFPSLSRSFPSKADALGWSRQKEHEVERDGLAQPSKASVALTVAEIMTRYRDEIVPQKRGADREIGFINGFLRYPIAQVFVGDLTTGMVSAFYDQRLRTVKPSSVNRELDVLRHAFAVARRNWDVAIASNPFALISRKRGSNPRERRIWDGERVRLERACKECRNPHMALMVRLALETGMRRGELLSAKWCNVSIERRTLHIEHTKNGYPRTIPLSTVALAIIAELEARRDAADGRLIPLTVDAVKMAWRRIVTRAAIMDLRFRDLRHEAISRFFEKGLNVPEVALISGHRDPRMLFRYTHPKAELVALKLG